jgi:D-alanyl-D-alanine carboxypeptidase (penicillin-binding protein 5/6)
MPLAASAARPAPPHSQAGWFRLAWASAFTALTLGSMAGAKPIAADSPAAQSATPTADPAPQNRYPRAAVAYAAMLDGTLLWGRNLDMRREPASLTKLLTALVVLENNWQPDAVLTVSHEAAHINRARVGLHTGDTVRAEDALNAMLMYSANDACMVLSQSVTPVREDFVSKMNAKAQQLGLRDSHFMHPCGFDTDGQYSTARDLLRLALAAHANPTIARIVQQSEGSLTTGKGRVIPFHSTNHLLGHLDGVMGLKTGFTAQAGHCLIAVAEQDGHRVWVVLLDSHQRWNTARRIITDAFTSGTRVAATRSSAHS